MALLTSDIQNKLVKLLVDEGLVSKDKLDEAAVKSTKESKPLLAILGDDQLVDDEMLTHAIAQVSGVPYVNLSNSLIDRKSVV